MLHPIEGLKGLAVMSVDFNANLRAIIQEPDQITKAVWHTHSAQYLLHPRPLNAVVGLIPIQKDGKGREISCAAPMREELRSGSTLSNVFVQLET